MKVNSFISTALAIIAAPCVFAVPVPYDGQMEPGEYEISTLTQLTNFTQKVLGYTYAGSTTEMSATRTFMGFF